MISQSEIAVFEFARQANGWFTSRVAAKKTGINPRTVRFHLLRLTQIGVLERRTSFGGCRYRLVTLPGDRAKDHIRELEHIQETFKKGKGIGAKFAALFAKQPRRTRIADGLPPDEAVATLAWELAHIGRLTRSPRPDYFNRVLEDIESAWVHQEQCA